MKNRLTFIKEYGRNKHNQKLGLFKCSCGNEKIIEITLVKNNKTRSCGCLQKEIIKKIGKNNIKHSLTHSSEYRCWINIKARCYNKKDISYKNYGGRGITVCNHWLESFENFYNDMGNKPSNRHCIDRINNNGNYCKENCKWATYSEEMRNQRNNRLIIYNNIEKPLVEWAKEYNIRQDTLSYRLKRGWNIKKALTHPIQIHKKND